MNRMRLPWSGQLSLRILIYQGDWLMAVDYKILGVNLAGVEVIIHLLKLFEILQHEVEQGNVTRVTIKSDNSVTGNFKTPVRAQQTGAGQGSVASTQFTSFIPATGDPSLLPLLKKQGVEISAQPVQPSWWQTALVLLLNALPVLLLLYFGVMSWQGMRQMQNLQGGGLFGLTRSRAKLYTPERPTTTFEDVAGLDEV